jgi:dipeptidyl-peptidase-4
VDRVIRLSSRSYTSSGHDMKQMNRNPRLWPNRAGRHGPRFSRNCMGSVACLVVGACLVVVGFEPAGAQQIREDYARWQTYEARTRDRVFRDSVKPNWFGPGLNRFWYRVKTAADAHQYVLVDAGKGERVAAFDHRELAAAIGRQTKATVRHDQLDLRGLTFADDANTCYFRLANQDWRLQLPAGPLLPNHSPPTDGVQIDRRELQPLTRVRRSGRDSSQRTPIRFDNRLSETLECLWVTPGGEFRSYGKVAAKSSRELSTFAGHAWVLRSDEKKSAAGAPDSAKIVASFIADSKFDHAIIDTSTPKPAPLAQRRGGDGANRNAGSPDGRWRVSFDQGNVVIVNLKTGNQSTATTDASDSNVYRGPVWWSPDSNAFVLMKTQMGTERMINLIDSAPNDSIHAQLIKIPYAKPGDEIDHPRPVLFHVDQFQPQVIDDALFDNPFGINDLDWRNDSSSFSFVYNQRGHQALRLISVDAATAAARIVIDETSRTFVCYSGKKYLRRLDDSDEVIWMSERSGWNHLYLIDAVSGRVQNAITSGEWVVRGVERVDTEQRRIWLKVSGIDPDQDPYHVHLIRVDFDGKNLTRLTSGDGDHQWDWSPDGRYLVDRYSRVDLPPVIELRHASTPRLICNLETADASRLLETPWAPPERFVAKGRDGQTDIHGIIIRPTDFDPQKSYPVLESIYAGPHSAFVPKQFGRHTELYRMAELGFIVVKIDGMGTSHRGKAFHDVCWQNLADSGFPDRIAWIKAAAKDRPEMDLSRVGIWGGSAGGQSAMRALIAHGDFYHAAVADCGCHDNRVDKIWWNEQWMGWPIDSHYAEQSNVTLAHQLRGDLLLIWGELDRNVDPASSMQVIDALVRAGKDFDMLIMPGVGHGAAGHPYARRRQADFFVRKLRDREVGQVSAGTDR